MLLNTTPEEFLRSVDDAKEARRQEKLLDRATEHRRLDPWERYRALTDQYDRLTDITEQGDRKTRFALLILGSINAVNLLIVTRGNWSSAPQLGHPVVAGYVACYALLSLCFFVYAISALRPRRIDAGGDSTASSGPLLRLDAAAKDRSPEAYAARWQQAEVGELNAEIAAMVHVLSQNNAEKLVALQRVYLGLYVLVAMTATALVAIWATDLGGT